MKFDAWLNYPSITIAVERVDEGYRCVKFVEESIVRGGAVFCEDERELKHFLLSIPNPPKKEISELIASLS
ncbi:MAG: hypothetical protein WDZ35_15780 [Crocinitomicaceae bacterium]